VSRNTQSSGVWGETLTLRSLPFTRRVISAMSSLIDLDEVQHGSENVRKGKRNILKH